MAVLKYHFKREYKPYSMEVEDEEHFLLHCPAKNGRIYRIQKGIHFIQYSYNFILHVPHFPLLSIMTCMFVCGLSSFVLVTQEWVQAWAFPCLHPRVVAGMVVDLVFPASPVDHVPVLRYHSLPSDSFVCPSISTHYNLWVFMYFHFCVNIMLLSCGRYGSVASFWADDIYINVRSSDLAFYVHTQEGLIYTIASYSGIQSIHNT